MVWSRNTMAHACGGTLVGDRYVITAAHCTNGIPDDITVLIGETTLGVANDTTQFIKNVSEIRNHPEYNFTSDDNPKNDIAVLVLSSPVDLFTYPNIKPACLPTTETRADMFGRDAVVSGWGRVGKDEPLHSHLQEIRTRIQPHCDNYTGK